MAKRFYMWLVDEWQGIITVSLIGFIGGVAGASVPAIWFFYGVCG